MQRKTNASIAFPLLILMMLALTISSFLFVGYVDACRRHKPPHPPRHPPLGKYIYITFTCSRTGKPIVGLPVTIVETGDIAKTNDKGLVVFGSGYPPGRYTWSFEWWDGIHNHAETIDCSKQNWYFKETLPNLEVHKWFYIKVYGEPVPYEGLEVTLNPGYGTKTTDEDGYVEWILDYPFGSYTLEWSWNGDDFSEPVVFEPGQGVWDKTNYLDPKSGGGI